MTKFNTRMLEGLFSSPREWSEIKPYEFSCKLLDLLHFNKVEDNKWLWSTDEKQRSSELVTYFEGNDVYTTEATSTTSTTEDPESFIESFIIIRYIEDYDVWTIEARSPVGLIRICDIQNRSSATPDDLNKIAKLLKLD